MRAPVPYLLAIGALWAFAGSLPLSGQTQDHGNPVLLEEALRAPLTPPPPASTPIT